MDINPTVFIYTIDLIGHEIGHSLPFFCVCVGREEDIINTFQTHDILSPSTAVNPPQNNTMILCNDETKDLPSAPELLYYYYYLLQLSLHTDCYPTSLLTFQKT